MWSVSVQNAVQYVNTVHHQVPLGSYTVHFWDAGHRDYVDGSRLPERRNRNPRYTSVSRRCRRLSCKAASGKSEARIFEPAEYPPQGRYTSQADRACDNAKPLSRAFHLLTYHIGNSLRREAPAHPCRCPAAAKGPVSPRPFSPASPDECSGQSYNTFDGSIFSKPPLGKGYLLNFVRLLSRDCLLEGFGSRGPLRP